MRQATAALSILAVHVSVAWVATSAFVPLFGAPRNSPISRRFSLNVDDKHNHVQSLWVFVHTLQRERREKGPRPKPGTPSSKLNFHSAKSLAIFLQENRFVPPAGDHPSNVEPFSRAVVQAIRLASELGDYKLILHLVESSIAYANQHPIIMPRVLGEAIYGMAKTTANIAKIKQLWTLGSSESAKKFLTEPLGTFELNVMIKATASRGKIKAALDLYRDHVWVNDSAIAIVPDPYTLSSIFTALQESVTEEQVTKQQQQQQNATTGFQTHPSQCWQWNQAMGLLTSYLDQNDWPTLNNHVFSSLLKLNERVSQVYLPQAHDGPKMAVFLLNLMHDLNISPDVVTCTLIISNLGYQWKTAVNLLYAMKTTPVSAPAHSIIENNITVWKLPRPNVYTYSAIITICAHCHQYEAAMELLQEMKNDKDNANPNTWVYNAALLATTQSDSLAVLTAETSNFPQSHSKQRSAPKSKKSRERWLMAVKLLREMQRNPSCPPDTVTYNTVLATLVGIASPLDENIMSNHLLASYFESMPPHHCWEERAVHCLMEEMTLAEIPRDGITYRNALMAIRYSQDIRASVWRILDRALQDKQALSMNNNLQAPQSQRGVEATQKARQLDGKAADGVKFVFDTAMTVLASHGDVQGVLLAFHEMMDRFNSPTANPKQHALTAEKIASAQVHLVHSLGRGTLSSSGLIPVFLNATLGDSAAMFAMSKEYPTIDSRLFQSCGGMEALFSAAISACLVANDIDKARKILRMMRQHGLQPSEVSLQEIARTYARLAVMATAEEIEKANTIKRSTAESVDEPSLAATRAKNAFTIATKTLSDPPASLLSTVARTCANLGMWEEASSILKLIHSRIPQRTNEISNIGSVGAARAVLPGLHRALLRASSIQGNVTAALWFVDDIQKLSSRVSKSTSTVNEEEDLLLSHSGEKASDQASLLSPDVSLDIFGMSGEDWKLLMIAASKCGHWRVCLSTLQFLRPFLEETHPSSLGSTVEERSRRYGHLAPALTVALKCLEVRSQYGWAVRAIDDWIEWCNRRPPKAAVLAAIRVMSKRGQGAEVNRLLERCTRDEGAALLSYGNKDGNYELALYVGAITALHHEGLYDDADDAFIAAVRENFLPFDLQNVELDGKQSIFLDLHGMNVPVAHSAVRVALQHEVERVSWMANPSAKASDDKATGNVWNNDMVIVTGRGKNSALRMRPVLRPEVQRMLVEEFFPPLNTASIPGNMGAVRLRAEDIQKWLTHQRQQKGSRMLAVASVIRSVSSIDRIRQSIALKIKAEQAKKAD